jgi:hypothetical protein
MISTQAGRIVRQGSSLTFHRPFLAHHPRALVLPEFVTIPSPSMSTYPHSQHRYQNQGTGYQQCSTFLMAASAIIAAAGSISGVSVLSRCEASSNGSSSSSSSSSGASDEEKQDQLPIYTMAQVSQNNGEGPGKRVWMTYGGCVYDVTEFIDNHPGGSQKILLAAGGPIEPHWHGE